MGPKSLADVKRKDLV
jgi:succinate-semialdehyde dehydrogenase / glutarate-semialdehyde dehydrogenase